MFGKMLYRNKKGFTLIELLIVVAIIGILAAVGAVVIPNVLGNAKDKVTEKNHNLVVSSIKKDVVIFELNGSIDRKQNNGSIISFTNKARAFDCSSFQHHFKDIKSPYADTVAKSKQQDIQVWGGRCCSYGKEGRTYVTGGSGKSCYFATYLSNNVLLEDTVHWGD